MSDHNRLAYKIAPNKPKAMGGVGRGGGGGIFCREGTIPARIG